MNIDPLKTTSSAYAQRPNGHAAQEGARTAAGSQAEESDTIATQLSDKVRETLASMPEVRPEVVARGRALLNDSSYPGPEIVNKIAALITPLAAD